MPSLISSARCFFPIPSIFFFRSFKQAKSAPKARPKKDEKVYIEIEPLSTRPDRPGRGRGRGRGDRARGSGRGRGAPRSPPQFNTPSLDVGDQTAFPSLV